MRVSSGILFVLGFHLSWDSMVAKCMLQVFQYCSGASWALVLYQPTDCGTVRPISWRSINLEFYPLQKPPRDHSISRLI